MTPATALEVIRSWPIEDQLELASRLWDELAPAGREPPPELAAELDRRLAEYEADPTNVVTWEQVMDKLRPR